MLSIRSGLQDWNQNSILRLESLLGELLSNQQLVYAMRYHEVEPSTKLVRLTGNMASQSVHYRRAIVIRHNNFNI